MQFEEREAFVRTIHGVITCLEPTEHNGRTYWTWLKKSQSSEWNDAPVNSEAQSDPTRIRVSLRQRKENGMRQILIPLHLSNCHPHYMSRSIEVIWYLSWMSVTGKMSRHRRWWFARIYVLVGLSSWPAIVIPATKLALLGWIGERCVLIVCSKTWMGISFHSPNELSCLVLVEKWRHSWVQRKWMGIDGQSWV